MDEFSNVLVGSAQDLARYSYPDASPLPSGGVATLAYVIDSPGTYFVRTLGTRVGGYQLEMRLFRPVLEQKPPGTRQILFLDFDGATLNLDAFGVQPPVGESPYRTLSPLRDFIGGWGLRDTNQLIDRIVAGVAENFADLRFANNPNYGIEIRNSRDHHDPFGQPNVSRVIVGGTIEEFGNIVVGQATSVDVGNFVTEETAVVLLDLLSSPREAFGFPEPDSLNKFPIAPGAHKVDLVGTAIANAVTHEAGHYLGGFHTDNRNDVINMMDTGGIIENLVGVGPDGIWGTQDDIDVDFVDDVYAPDETFFGVQNTPNAIAFGLSLGGTRAATQVTGFKWNDLDADGVRDAGEPPIAGTRVYVDVNGDERHGIGEPAAITAADGSYTIRTAPVGMFAIREVVDPGFVQTFPPGGEHLVNIRPASELTNLDFGNRLGQGSESGVDYSHGPASFGVAAHAILPGLRLGQRVDGESGPGNSDGSDDDGVFIGDLVPGQVGSADVVIANGTNPPGVLQGWIDFDRNGQYTSDERVARDLQLPEGISTISFSVPAGSRVGPAQARFRYGYERGIGPTGFAIAGEVEDHVVDVGVEPGPEANDDFANVPQGSVNFVIDVLANDEVAPGRTLSIVQVSTPDQGGAAAASANRRRVLYTPDPDFFGTETFVYEVSDGTRTDTARVTVTVEETPPEEPAVGFRFQLVDAAGEPIDEAPVGSSFQLQVFTQDLRPEPEGVFAGYLDIEYDESLVSVTGEIDHGQEYLNQRSGDTTTPGLVDEAGGFSISTTPIGGDEFLLLSVPMQADAAGLVGFAGDPADITPAHFVLVFGSGQPVDANLIDYGAAELVITAPPAASTPFTNPGNSLDVNDDGLVSPIDPLMVINELNANGSRPLNPSAAPVSGAFIDVNGDNYISALDALLIINHLNKAVAGEVAEGEPAAALPVAAHSAPGRISAPDDLPWAAARTPTASGRSLPPDMRAVRSLAPLRLASLYDDVAQEEVDEEILASISLDLPG
jgi:hypothetical protein